MGINGFTNPVPLGDPPAGWTIQAIESLCQKVTSGGTPLRSNPNFYQNGTIRWFKTKELNDGYLDDSEEKITPLAIEKTSAKLFPPNTVLMAMYGDGKTITSLGILRKESATNQACCALIADPSTCNHRFLFYALKLHRNDFIQLATGGAQRNLSGNLIRNFAIKVPPLDEQKAIAQILSSLDDKIELNQQMNRTLEAIARALFKSWFIDFDPVRAKLDGRQPAGMDAETAALFPAEFEDSAIGQIPKGWKAVPLPEAIEVNPTRSLPKGKLAPYLDMQNMLTQGHRPNGWIYREFGSGTKFMQGDTLLARITPCLENGKTAFVDFLPDQEVGWGSTEYIIFRPKAPLPVEFGYFLARSDELRTHAIQNMTGSSGRQRAPANCFSSYFLAVPSEPVAQKFGDAVVPSMRLIKAYSEQNTTLTSIRDALLLKLLSGEVCVKDAEKIVGAVA